VASDVTGVTDRILSGKADSRSPGWSVIRGLPTTGGRRGRGPPGNCASRMTGVILEPAVRA